MLSKLFCKHTWILLQEVTSCSPIETFKRETGNHLTPKDTETLLQMTSHKHITTFTCDKCGKIKRFVEGV